MIRSVLAVSSLALLAACATDMPVNTDPSDPEVIGYEPIEDLPPETDMSVPGVTADMETVPVETFDDAADDPAFWIDPINPSASLLLGTDKKAGLYAYSLNGSVKQFLPIGALNNVDVRQGVTIDGWTGDLAAATNRTDDSVTLFTITESGWITEAGRFSSLAEEPYGFCMGDIAGDVLLVVTYKDGKLELHRVDQVDGGVAATHLETVKLDSQLEGCVFDDSNAGLFVGEENAGITRFTLDMSASLPLVDAARIDLVGSRTGIVADIEGLTIYRANETEGYLLASSQGNNTYAAYDRQTGKFVARFRIASDVESGIDGAEETDGIDVTAFPLPGYPAGAFAVQDGYNDPAGQAQNYKLVDWRKIEAVLDAAR